MKAARKTVRKGTSSVKVSSTLGIGHSKADVRMVEIDNPHFSRTHTGSPGNPKTITAAINLRESPIAMMAAKGHLETHQVEAAIKFRRLWETLGGAGAGSSDYAKEPVDGGGARDPITDHQIDAGLELKACSLVIGRRAYDIVEKVAGEGRTITELGSSHRERTTLADYLRNALEDLSEHWGYRNRRAKARA